METTEMTAPFAPGRVASNGGRDNGPASVGKTLVFGVADEVSSSVVLAAIAARVQLTERFAFGRITADAWTAVPEWEHRLLVHNLVVHLEPGALAILEGDAGREHAEACGLEPIDPAEPGTYRRTDRTTIHDLVAEARADLVRIAPQVLAEHLAEDPKQWLVLDTRTPTDRERFGVIPGSLHMPRTTLEWMADPASGYSHDDIVGFDQHLVCVCNEGYSSSLSAASLQRLGFVNATDLIGGVMGWKAAGLPTEQPDHTRFN